MTRMDNYKVGDILLLTQGDVEIIGTIQALCYDKSYKYKQFNGIFIKGGKGFMTLDICSLGEYKIEKWDRE